MDNRMNQLLRELARKDYEGNVSIAKSLIGTVFGVFLKNTDKEGATDLMNTFIASVITSDGAATDAELSFLRDAFGAGAETVIEIAGTVDIPTYAMLDKAADALSAGEKALLMYLACTVAALDGEVNEGELAYIEKLLA